MLCHSDQLKQPNLFAAAFNENVIGVEQKDRDDGNQQDRCSPDAGAAFDRTLYRVHGGIILQSDKSKIKRYAENEGKNIEKVVLYIFFQVFYDQLINVHPEHRPERLAFS